MSIVFRLTHSFFHLQFYKKRQHMEVASCRFYFEFSATIGKPSEHFDATIARHAQISVNLAEAQPRKPGSFTSAGYVAHRGIKDPAWVLRWRKRKRFLRCWSNVSKVLRRLFRYRNTEFNGIMLRLQNSENHNHPFSRGRCWCHKIIRHNQYLQMRAWDHWRTRTCLFELEPWRKCDRCAGCVFLHQSFLKKTTLLSDLKRTSVLF